MAVPTTACHQVVLCPINRPTPHAQVLVKSALPTTAWLGLHRELGLTLHIPNMRIDSKRNDRRRDPSAQELQPIGRNLFPCGISGSASFVLILFLRRLPQGVKSAPAGLPT